MIWFGGQGRGLLEATSTDPDARPTGAGQAWQAGAEPLGGNA